MAAETTLPPTPCSPWWPCGVKARVKAPLHCHFEEADRPSVIRLHYVRDQLIAV